MNGTKRAFRKGEFITNTNKPGSFAIFEGNECESYGSFKKYTAVLSFEPSKHHQVESGEWVTSPYLDIAVPGRKCETTVDGDTESYWWRPCTDKEKERALDILQGYGYFWNEELKAVIARESGEIIKSIVEPKLEYNGEVVKTASSKLKDLLRKVCDAMIKDKYSYSTRYYCYGDFWDGDYWD